MFTSLGIVSLSKGINNILYRENCPNLIWQLVSKFGLQRSLSNSLARYGCYETHCLCLCRILELMGGNTIYLGFWNVRWIRHTFIPIEKRDFPVMASRLTGKQDLNSLAAAWLIFAFFVCFSFAAGTNIRKFFSILFTTYFIFWSHKIFYFEVPKESQSHKTSTKSTNYCAYCKNLHFCNKQICSHSKWKWDFHETPWQGSAPLQKSTWQQKGLIKLI